MHKASRIVFVALLVAAFTTANALACSTERDTNYYDSNGCWQGEQYQGCNFVNCHTSTTGTITGAHWKHVEVWDCDTGAKSTDQWYEWNGSSWVAVSDPGLPGC